MSLAEPARASLPRLPPQRMMPARYYVAFPPHQLPLPPVLSFSCSISSPHPAPLYHQPQRFFRAPPALWATRPFPVCQAHNLATTLRQPACVKSTTKCDHKCLNPRLSYPEAWLANSCVGRGRLRCCPCKPHTPRRRIPGGALVLPAEQWGACTVGDQADMPSTRAMQQAGSKGSSSQEQGRRRSSPQAPALGIDELKAGGAHPRQQGQPYLRHACAGDV